MKRQGAAFQVLGRMMLAPAPDGHGVAWIENSDPERYKGVFPLMVLVVSRGGKEIRCRFDECSAQRLVGFHSLWWLGDEIVFMVTDGPANSLTSFYAWNPGKDTRRTILRSDARFARCERCDARLICGYETWTSPLSIASLDLRSGALASIADVNPAFKAIDFTRVEKIVGEDDKGHEVYGHLVYPKDYRPGRRYPLIVTQYHSYGFLRGATGDEQPIHAYAANGIVVLSFDARQNHNVSSREIPHPESVATHFTNLYIDQQPARAIEKMVDKLVKRGLVDPDRVGITGFSMGDQILDTALMRRNYAATSSAGLSSVPIYTKFPPGYISGDAFDKIFGSALTEEGRKNRAKYSLAVHASKIDTPILMQVSDDEFSYMDDTFYALQKAGKPVEMYQYPDELHVKSQPSHKYWVYRRNLDWFRFWLL